MKKKENEVCPADHATGQATLRELLRVAKCPECDGSGHIPVPLGENFVSHEMAIDAGEPSMEGQSMGIEWGDQQCQWCAEREAILGSEVHASQAPSGDVRKEKESPSLRQQGEKWIWTDSLTASDGYAIVDSRGRLIVEFINKDHAIAVVDAHNASCASRGNTEATYSKSREEVS